MSKQIKHIFSKKQDAAVREAFFDEEGHLNDRGMIAYVQAKLLNREDEIIKPISQHVEHCAKCQTEVMLFYEMMQDEDPSEIDPKSQDLQMILSPVRKQWTQRPLLRTAAMIAIVFISSLVLLFLPQRNEPSNNYSPFTQANVEAKTMHWTVKNNRPYTIYTPKGVKIKIPAQAFIDEKGNLVQGKVDVAFKELRKASEILASGLVIPLDSAGKKMTLESFGMFEIRASQGDKVLQLAQNKRLEVEMPLSDYAENLSNYYLVESNQALNQIQVANASAQQARWQYLGKSQLKISHDYQHKSLEDVKAQKNKEIDSLANLIRQTQEKILQEQTSLNSIEKTIPQATSDYFKIELNELQYQVQNSYRKQIWQYVGEESKLSPTQGQDWVLREKWDKVELRETHYRPLTLSGHQAGVNKAIFSPDEQLVVTASADHTLRLWSAEAQYLKTLHGHQAAVNDVDFSPNGRYLVSASQDHSLKIWQRDGQLIKTINGHQGAVLSVKFSPDGYYILSHSSDGTAKLWNTSGSLLATLPHNILEAAPVFSPNGKYIASIKDKNQIHLLSVDDASVKKIDGDFKTLAFSPNSNYFVTTAVKRSGKLKLYASNSRLLRTYDFNAEDALFSADGQHIITKQDERLRLWFFNQNNPYNLVLTRNISNISKEYRSGHQQNINYFASNKNYVMSASEDYTAKIWTAEGKILHSLRGHTGAVKTIDCSPNGKTFVTASDDKTARIWVERQNRDVYEMRLLKDERIIKDQKGNKVHIPGKEFFTIVRKVESEQQDAIKIIKKPRVQENILEQLLVSYEQTIAEKEALDTQKELPHPNVSQILSLDRLGIYNCARVYPSTPLVRIKQAYIHFENAKPENPTTVYHITSKHGVAIIPYQYYLNEAIDFSYDPSAYNSLVVILDKNRVCQFSNHDFATISPLVYREQHGLYRFDVSPPVQVSSLASLSSLMR